MRHERGAVTRPPYRYARMGALLCIGLIAVDMIRVVRAASANQDLTVLSWYLLIAVCGAVPAYWASRVFGRALLAIVTAVVWGLGRVHPFAAHVETAYAVEIVVFLAELLLTVIAVQVLFRAKRGDGPRKLTNAETGVAALVAVASGITTALPPWEWRPAGIAAATMLLVGAALTYPSRTGLLGGPLPRTFWGSAVSAWFIEASVPAAGANGLMNRVSGMAFGAAVCVGASLLARRDGSRR